MLQHLRRMALMPQVRAQELTQSGGGGGWMPPADTPLFHTDLEVLCLALPRLQGPVLELGEGPFRVLDELLVEGDLLEVTLDEAQSAWRLAQAARPPPVATFRLLLEVKAPPTPLPFSGCCLW